jgi:class 3 adenylate cyclase
MARAVSEVLTESDVRDKLARMTAPTLILHRRDRLFVAVEQFVTSVRSGFDTERVLTTIVFTDIVGSTNRAAALGDLHWHHLLDNHDRIVRHRLERFRGREVNTAGDGFVATFTSPSEVLVSSTEREIVTGSRRTFDDRGEHELKGRARSTARARARP